jgi:putative membrane protein
MSLTRRVSLVLALAVLGSAWLGPLPDLAGRSFAAHMTTHMGVVAIAAPLLALALGGTRADPVRKMPNAVAAIPASMIELFVVWVWHVPSLHHAARQFSGVFALEQASFFTAGTLLWIAALGGDREQRRLRAGGGITALLFTSMHMTLLGALFALANRPLFEHATSVAAVDAVSDQQLGGVIMLLVGAASYLVGGLGLTAAALRSGVGARAGRQESIG